MKKYYSLDDDLLILIENVVGKTDYKNEDIPESVYAMLEGLLYEITDLEEKIEDIIQDRNDNWKQQTVAEQVGISDRDFY